MRPDDLVARKALMDEEHSIEFDLIRALQEAVSQRQERAVLKQILDQLISFTEAHFRSEELLMRLASYDDYAEHADDHRQLLESLTSIQQRYHSTGQPEYLTQVVRSAMAFLTRHIQSRDARFADWQPA